MTDKRSILLNKIKSEIINLKESPLYAERITNKVFPVIGEGNHYAKIMFVGEAPGRNEAQKGRPFCGTAGKILDELLSFIEIERSDIYITNIVKDRPPNNRDPEPEEIKIYAPFLDRQIEIIQPQAIAALGRFSSHYLMEKFDIKEKNEPISKIHGTVFNAQTGYGQIKIIPLFHPASVIYDSKKKQALIEDFQVIKKILEEIPDLS